MNGLERDCMIDSPGQLFLNSGSQSPQPDSRSWVRAEYFVSRNIKFDK